MSWEFFTKAGVMKEGIQSAVGDADTLDGLDSTAFVKTGGSAMTGFLTLSAAPSLANHAATRDYVDTTASTQATTAAGTRVLKAGDTMTGSLTMAAGNFVILNDNPTLPTHATRRAWIDATFLPLAGGTLTGTLALSAGAHVNLSNTSNLSWTDVAISRTAPGVLTLGGGQQIRVQQDPDDDNDLARKSYVDSVVGAGGATMLSQLTDVDPGLAPINGHVLVYDGFIDTRWESVAPLWVDKAGDTMVGDLILDVGAPNNAQLTFDNADGSSDVIVQAYVGAEANPRLSVTAGGNISWGAGGASVADVTLSRHGAGDMLTVDGNVVLPLTTVTFAMSPFALTKAHRTVLVDSSTGAITVNLPASHSAGQVFEVKDSGANASSNNVTINRNGSLIDNAAANKVLITNSESVVLVSNGSGWFSLSTTSGGSIHDLTDVTTTGAADGAIFRYEATGAQWADTTALLFTDANQLRVRSDGNTGGITLGALDDTNLYRSGPDLLKTDDRFEVGISGGKTTVTLSSTGADTGITLGGDTNLYRSAANTLATDDSLTVLGNNVTVAASATGGFVRVGSATGSRAYESRVTGDAQYRFMVDADGRLSFGGGAAVVDTNLYRNAPNELKTDDAFTVNGKLTYEAGLNVRTTTKTANYTVDLATDYIILCDTATAAGAFTITLPASHSEGDSLIIKDSTGQADVKNVTINPSDADTIDGNTTHILTTTYEWVTLVSDGTNWSVVG